MDRGCRGANVSGTSLLLDSGTVGAPCCDKEFSSGGGECCGGYLEERDPKTTVGICRTHVILGSEALLIGENTKTCDICRKQISSLYIHY